MTNEEARKILDDMYGEWRTDEEREALEVAIKALEQEPKTEKVIKMRDVTPEERESIEKYIKSISKPTGVVFGKLEQEPKTGRWIKTIGENGITSAVRCSECGFEDNRYMLFRYCPNCGAKME